ncbi:MAG: hypothetical protein GXP37_14835 [Chloroflexi bacterium]|nr:hypothetical protein [Chloroflexota bacterium]
MTRLNEPLLAARSADLRDVGYRVLWLLVKANTRTVSLPDHPVIIVAQDLAPSDTAALDPGRVLGFCTAAGGPTSHTAIIARALRLPAMVSAGSRVMDLENGTLVILNGDNGTLTIAPDAKAIALAETAQRRQQARRRTAQQSALEPAVTQDGHRVEVAANVAGPAEAEQAVASGAEGIGLLRTEFLLNGQRRLRKRSNSRSIATSWK